MITCGELKFMDDECIQTDFVTFTEKINKAALLQIKKSYQKILQDAE